MCLSCLGLAIKVIVMTMKLASPPPPPKQPPAIAFVIRFLFVVVVVGGGGGGCCFQVSIGSNAPSLRDAAEAVS